MSSRRVGNASSKGKGVSQSNPNVEHLAQGVANVNLGSGQDEGQWEVYSKKTKNKGGSSAPKQWAAPPAHNSNPRAWGNADMAQKAGGRNHGGAGRGAGNPWQQQNANYMR
ncbi:protein SUPPRESSOR OF GENE SILENCING 3-like, partial [Trifolium medium]|nr:protein SUPPRESSOR OF GENE SILENCING 3-like [Trifolium medium]